MQEHLPSRERELRERNRIATAFVEDTHPDTDLTSCQEHARQFLLNTSGEHLPQGLTDDIRRAIARISVLLPVYNQKRTIGPTIQYLTDELHIPPAHITAASCSTDGSNDVMRELGVEVLDQYRTFRDLVHEAKFLEIMGASSLADLRGKGLTMFTGHLHRVLQGSSERDGYVLQTDTDIENIGSGPGEWNPIGYFANAITQHPQIDTLKAAKNGRNNQPMHIFLNTWPLYGEHGADYQRQLGGDRWLLTGEYGWRESLTECLRWATGYAIEMTLNISKTDLALRNYQVNIPETRNDAQNSMTKETVMYSDIQRLILGILLTRKRLHDLSLSEIAALNQRLDGYLTFYCFETDENPGPDARPNDVTRIKPSRIIPDIQTLQREGIVYSGA